LSKKHDASVSISVYFHGMFSFQEQNGAIVARAPIIGPELGSALSAHVYKWGSLSKDSPQDLNVISKGDHLNVSAATPGVAGTLGKLLPILNGTPGGVDPTLQYCSVQLSLPDMVTPLRNGAVVLSGPLMTTGSAPMPFLLQFTYNTGALTVTADVGNELSRMHKLSPSVILTAFVTPPAPAPAGSKDQQGLDELSSCSGTDNWRVPHCFSVIAP
jgi:hypothetical protein